MFRWQHILCILSLSKADSLGSKCKEKEQLAWASARHSSKLCDYRNFISKKPWMDILVFCLKLFLPRYTRKKSSGNFVESIQLQNSRAKFHRSGGRGILNCDWKGLENHIWVGVAHIMLHPDQTGYTRSPSSPGSMQYLQCTSCTFFFFFFSGRKKAETGKRLYCELHLLGNLSVGAFSLLCDWWSLWKGNFLLNQFKILYGNISSVMYYNEWMSCFHRCTTAIQ